MGEAFSLQHGARKRNFCAADLVYGKMFRSGKMIRYKGKIIEKIDYVMYNILVELENNDILYRKHCNQIRNRL